jgi:hypothetical protein
MDTSSTIRSFTSFGGLSGELSFAISALLTLHLDEPLDAGEAL